MTRQSGRALFRRQRGRSATVDAEGPIWSAPVLISRIARFGRQRRQVRIVEMAVAESSGVVFCSRDLDILNITRISLSATGGLFEVTGPGVRGLPVPRSAE